MFVKRSVVLHHVVGAHDGGIAPCIARTDIAFFQHRNIFDTVVFSQVIGGRQTMSATTDDDDVIAFARLGVAPGAIPMLVATKGVAQQRPGRVVRHRAGSLHAHAFGFGVKRRVHLQTGRTPLTQDFNL